MERQREEFGLLLVEDNPGDALLVRQMLHEANGHLRIRVADRLDDALSLLARTRFDAVLLDLSLPDSHGLDTLYRVCEVSERLPIVVLTGLDDRTVGIEAVRAGAQDYLIKGQFDGPLLERAIRYAVERKRMEKEKRQLMRMKDDFISLVSHQLRTPLASASGFLELILDDKVPDPETQREFLGRTNEEVQRLVKLVDTLLNLSRLEAGRLPLTKEAFDLGDLIDETVRSLETTAAEREIALRPQTPTSSVVLWADRRWIREVLFNLVTNAIKFSPPGRAIDIFCRVADGKATVAVRDEGTGIAEADLAKIFDRFYQAESTAKNAGTGAGLGLYLAKGIVEAHDGKMNVKSKVGEGSVFLFTLPLGTYTDGN